jgi:light-regulated signal transduction histidine kinase (bacteriophytochrome)
LAPGTGAAEAGAQHRHPEALDLTLCDREAIHLAGAIQPHGILLVAEMQTGVVVAGAGEIEDRITSHWLGRSLSELVAQKLDRAIEQARSMPGMVVPLSVVPGRREALDASLFISGDHVVVELEPRPDIVGSAAAVLARLDGVSAGFERAGDLTSLCERAATAFRELTAYDRVMIYRFLDDGSGTVVAEDRDPALGSFLNHRFPASDIPRQARALYIRNRVRVIPDASYDPAPIRPAEAGLAGLDLSDSLLRSVSPIHLQYLRNMDVAASASVSIVKDGVLWGLVACHNRTPRLLGMEARAACRALAGGLARQIRAKEEAELYRERLSLRSNEEAILARLSAAGSAETLVRTTADEVRRLPNADGFALVSREGILRAGICPDEEQVERLAEWLTMRGAAEPFATNTLSDQFTPAELFRETASGLVALGQPGDGIGMMMWFRAEQLETVNWAGNPHKDMSSPASVLTPRASFDLWCETVRGRARRWTASEVEAVQHLRRALIEAQQSMRLRDLNRALNATIAEKEALLLEKDHLLREVNHRVQNSLQLVQAFLALQAQASGKGELADNLAEAQRRLSAVALVHRRLYKGDQVETVDLGRYLDDLVGDMRAALGPEWNERLRLDLAPIVISADRAINLGLILTELVINANKYAYAGKAGPLEIGLEQHGGTLRMIVADRGTGDDTVHKGFGTRMMNAMIQRLGGTIERQDNHPGLRVIVSAPIDQD